MSCAALPTCLFKQKHMCISGTYRDWDLKDGAVRAEWMVWPCEDAKAASREHGKAVSAEGEADGWPASPLCSAGGAAKLPEMFLSSDCLCSRVPGQCWRG